MILNDKQILELCEKEGMISPFVPNLVREVTTDSGIDKKIVSYGLSSYGYDIRVAHEFKIFTNVNNSIVDPHGIDESSFVDMDCSKQGFCIVPPNSFVLARTVELFKMPRDVMAICMGKSTYARVGCICLTTPLEPSWEGYLTLEFANTTPLPLKIYVNEGCAQLIFFKGDPCEVSYSDRSGKYMNQVGVVLPKV